MKIGSKSSLFNEFQQHPLASTFRHVDRLLADLAAIEYRHEAKQGHYVFGRHLDARLLDLDRRIRELDPP